MPAEATSFVGRRHELADARKKLASARLVSLVGPGGVGKTRLAIRVAASLGRGFPGGTWLAELAEVQDPALVGTTDWQRVTVRAKLPANSDTIRVGAMLLDAGTGWLDDVQLRTIAQ